MKRLAWLLSMLTTLLVSGSWGWERPLVAVLPLNAVGVEENAVVGVTEALQDSLISSGRYTVIERSRLAMVLEEQSLQLTGLSDTQQAVEVGRLVGAEEVLLGSVSRVGELYQLAVRLVDVTGATVVDSARRESYLLEGMIAAAEEIALELAERTPLIGTVVGLDDDEYAVIDLGGNLGIEKDDELVIFRYGEEYYSPETGAYLGRDRKVIGEGEIVVLLGPELSRIEYDLDNGELRVGDKVLLEESDKHWQLFNLIVEMATIGIEFAEPGNNLILSASGLVPAYAEHALSLDGVENEYNWRMSTGGTLKIEFPLEFLRLGAGMGAMVQYLSSDNDRTVIDVALHLVGTLGWNFVEGKVMNVGIRLVAGGAYHLPIFSSGLLNDVTVEGTPGYYFAVSFPVVEVMIGSMLGLEFGAGVVYAPYEFTVEDSGTEYRFTAGQAYGLHGAANIYF